jgi:hypothetical protein
LIWATVKNWVAEKDVTFKLDDVIKLTDESFAAITNEDEKKTYAYVQNIKAQYMSNEGILEGPEIVIRVGDDINASSKMTVVQTPVLKQMTVVKCLVYLRYQALLL